MSEALNRVRRMQSETYLQVYGHSWGSAAPRALYHADLVEVSRVAIEAEAKIAELTADLARVRKLAAEDSTEEQRKRLAAEAKLSAVREILDDQEAREGLNVGNLMSLGDLYANRGAAMNAVFKIVKDTK